MKNRKAFTLIELMVVILIVAILAAVAIPILRGRIDAAKWSEGKAGAGTISVALRAFEAEGRDANSLGGDLALLGFIDGDLDGTYFVDESYTFSWISNNNWDVTIDTAGGTPRDAVPSSPADMTLEVRDGEATWTPN